MAMPSPAPPGGFRRGGPALSRLPVRGARAKRPAELQEAAAVPEQKRARPGPAAAARPSAGGRVPLKALSAAAAPKPDASAAPVMAPSRRKRAAWDLKGQVSDLKEALSSLQKKSRKLDEENRELREKLETLQQDLGEREARESDLSQRLGTVSAELLVYQVESARWRREAEGLTVEKQRLEEDVGQHRQALAKAEGKAQDLAAHTMEGPDAVDPETRGMIPRAVRRVFQGAQELAEKGVCALCWCGNRGVAFNQGALT